MTYAALEARLALEKVVYDRLRQRHGYISHADLSGWSPSYIMKKLIAEVDPHVADEVILSLGQNSGAESEEDDYFEVGIQSGFNWKRISSLWNALSNVALHVRLPEDENDHIAAYGDKATIRAKVEEAVAELKHIVTGTMASSGVPIGGDVTFECACGQQNRRRRALLTDGQSISCLSPTCERSYSVRTQDDHKIAFELEVVAVPCSSCDAIHRAPERRLRKMKLGDHELFECMKCGHTNRVICALVRKKSEDFE